LVVWDCVTLIRDEPTPAVCAFAIDELGIVTTDGDPDEYVLVMASVLFVPKTSNEKVEFKTYFRTITLCDTVKVAVVNDFITLNM
jgi:hypothetical protein